MSELQIAKPDTASHWYLVDDKTGVKSFHSVPYSGKRGQNGETRKTTLRDARKVGAFPSVTNVLGILHKDFLEAYKINQAILASLTLPRIEGELDHDFAKRVVKDAKEHAASAARLGSRVHEVGEQFLKGIGSGKSIEAGERIEGRDLEKVCQPLLSLILAIKPHNSWTDDDLTEFYVSHPLGFAGTCDGMQWIDPSIPFVREKLCEAGYHNLANAGQPIVAMVDIKTRGADTKKPLVYETDILQLSAYLHAVPHTPNLKFPISTSSTPVCNLLLNTHPDAGKDGRWDAELVIHKKEEVDSAWEAFKAAHHLWCWVKKYNPHTDSES